MHPADALRRKIRFVRSMVSMLVVTCSRRFCSIPGGYPYARGSDGIQMALSIREVTCGRCSRSNRSSTVASRLSSKAQLSECGQRQAGPRFGVCMVGTSQLQRDHRSSEIELRRLWMSGDQR
jgi:hypothetical protein